MKPARIVVLAVAVAAGGMAALLAGRSEKPPAPAPVAQVNMVDVLSARSDIAMGQVLTADDMQWQAWPASAASSVFITKAARPDAIENLTGAIARTSFAPGEPLREAKLIKGNGSGFLAAMLPAGMRAISTEVNAETSAGGFILPNDHVDVILTRRDREVEKRQGSEAFTSETILRNVKVLAIDQTIQEKDGQKVVVGKTATLELTSRQAETLALSRHLGTLSLALRSLVDASRNEESTEDDRPARAGINMVRFGVTSTTVPK
ncbi:MAG: Flp pilus assembly protein CpaB [Variibacter sp.]